MIKGKLFFAVVLWLVTITGLHAATVQQPVSALFDALAEINGDKPVDGATAALPLICFDTDEGELPNPAKAKSAALRKQLAARRALLVAPVTNLAKKIVAAYHESGLSGGALQVRVIGHADSNVAKGKDPSYDANLSYRRAIAIAKVLRAELSRAYGRRIPLSLTVEGRSTFDPWRDASATCGSKARATAESAETDRPPIPADRRVEIEILNGALTDAGPTGDLRLRVYPAGTMPWRTVNVPLNKPSEASPACFDNSSANVPETAWVSLPFRNLIDLEDGNEGHMAVRLRAVPIYSPAISGVHVYLDIARERTGIGVPDYWSVHERLPLYLAGLVAGDKTLDRLAKCIDPSAPDGGYLAKRADSITDLALRSLPKDIDGLMASVQGLHRNLRFVDLKPGMKLVLKGSNADPFETRLQLGYTDTLRLISDPLDPCALDPVPRADDPILPPDKSAGPIASRPSFQSSITDPFLAWMTHSNSWKCGAKKSGPSGAGAEIAGDTASNNAKASSPTGPEAITSESPSASPTLQDTDVLATYSELDELFSNGPVRLFLPLLNNPKPIVTKNSAINVDQIREYATFVVSGLDRAHINVMTRAAATNPSDPTDRTSFNIPDACKAPVGKETVCRRMYSQETLTPFTSFNVAGHPVEQPIGSRVVHVIPSGLKLYDTCFDGNVAGNWAPGASLARALHWTAAPLPELAMADRHDCHLLGLPMLSGGSVSW
jgi:hypothetical protein